MRTTPDEARIVLLAQLGDREALEAVLRSVEPPLRRFVSRLVGPTDGDDVLQNTLIIIARKLNWLEEPGLFHAWAFRIASRAAFDLLKKRRRSPIHDSDDAVLEAIAAPATPPSDQALGELLNSERISPASRAVLALHFQEEMSLAEVAAILDVPLGTVKSRLAYGLKALRQQLGDRRSL